MKNIFKIYLLFFIFSIYIFSANFVSAEIFTKPNNQEHINLVTKTYISQVNDYRQSASEFEKSVKEYEKLQTLRSFNNAVESMNQVYQHRVLVLSSYCELLEARLLTTTGVPLEIKNPTLEELASSRVSLQAHGELINLSDSYEQLQDRYKEFADLGSSIRSQAYKAQSLIALGNAQDILDKSKSVRDEIELKHEQASTSALQQGRRERAMLRVEDQLDLVQKRIDDSYSILLKKQADKNVFSLFDYQRVVKDLEVTRSLLSQSAGFLDELLSL